VGALFATTGPLGSMGNDMLKSAQLAVKTINDSGGIKGRKVELLHEDFESDPSKALTLGRQLIEKGVFLIVGPNSTPAGLALRPITEQSKVFMFSGSTDPKSVQGAKFSFLATPDDQQKSKMVAKMTNEKLKWKKVAILYENNTYGINLNEFIGVEFKQLGITSVSVSYASDAKNLTSQWQRIKEEKVDGVYVAGSAYGTAGTLMRNRNDLGLADLPVLLEGPFNSEAFIKLAGNTVNGAYFVSSYDFGNLNDVQKKFFEGMKELNVPIPTSMNGSGFDYTYIPLYAAQQVGTDPEKMLEFLNNMKDFQGSLGSHTFTKDNHSGGRSLGIVQWDGKLFKTIDYMFLDK
jgi:branched-chain amino acid transport system substrate-binding protein